jgi:NADH-quinone oxidoreductase subunit J
VNNTLVYSLAFYVLAIALLASALLVVVLRNIVHAALALIATFFFVSWLYLMMNADLLWVAQLLIYAGAIPVLIVFAIMFTRRSMTDTSNVDSTTRPWAGIISVAVFGLLTAILVSAHWHLARWPDLIGTTGVLGRELSRTYVVPFELVSVLLLVGLIGAVLLAHQEREE